MRAAFASRVGQQPHHANDDDDAAAHGAESALAAVEAAGAAAHDHHQQQLTDKASAGDTTSGRGVKRRERDWSVRGNWCPATMPSWTGYDNSAHVARAHDALRGRGVVDAADDEVVVQADVAQFATMFTNGHGHEWVVHKAMRCGKCSLVEAMCTPPDAEIGKGYFSAAHDGEDALLHERHEVVLRCQSCPAPRFRMRGDSQPSLAGSTDLIGSRRIRAFTGFTNAHGKMLFLRGESRPHALDQL